MAQVQPEPVEAHLLRGRVALYGVVGILVAFALEAGIWERIGSIVIALAAAIYPLAATSRERRLALAAGADIAAGLLIWILTGEPVVSLLIVLWGLTITAFLNERHSRVRIVGAAVLSEVVKLPLVLAGFEQHRILGEETGAVGLADLGIQVGAKVLILVAAYQFLRLIGSVYVRAFNALRASALEHSSLIEDAPTPVVVLDGWTVEYANSEACRLFGVDDLMYLVASDFRALVGEADRRRLTSLLEMPSNDAVTLEDLVVLPLMGGRRIVDAALTTVTFAGADRTQLALNDVTFRSEAQIALAESEELFRGAFADSATPFGIATLDGSIVKVNAALLDLLGYPRERVIDRTWRELMDPEDWPAAGALVETALAEQGAPISVRAGFLASDGRSIPTLVNTSFVTDGAGQPVTMFTQLIDLSAQASAERQVERRISQQQAVARLGELALRNHVDELFHESARALSEHLDSFVTGVFRTLSNGTLVLAAGVGWPQSSIGNYHIPPGSSEQMDHLMTHQEPHIVESLSTETRFTPSDFLTTKGAAAGVSVQIRGHQAPLGAVGVWSSRPQSYSANDVHFVEATANLLAAAIERQQAKEQLEELVTSKDRFLASVSHELRTPLTVVTGMAAELEERWETFAPAEVAEFVRLIADQSRDMAALIEDLLVAARADIGAVTVKKVPVDMRREIETVVTAMPDIVLEANEVRHTPVLGDPTRLRQIIRNLLTNAKRYGGPRIRTASSFDGGVVTVSVADNGDGIPTELRARVFKPYERAHESKGVAGSVGLGLSVSRTLAELMGGKLTYRHVDGESIFDLTLPAASAPPVAHMVSLDEFRALS